MFIPNPKFETLQQEYDILKFEKMNMITSIEAYIRNEDAIHGKAAEITNFPTLSKRWKNIDDMFQKLTKEDMSAQTRDLDNFHENILDRGMPMANHCNMYS